MTKLKNAIIGTSKELLREHTMPKDMESHSWSLNLVHASQKALVLKKLDKSQAIQTSILPAGLIGNLNLMKISQQPQALDHKVFMKLMVSFRHGK